jgi:hypothetical protein
LEAQQKSTIDRTGKTLEKLKADPHRSQLLAKIPDKLKTELLEKSKADPNILMDFLSINEQKLDEWIIYAKEHNREIHQDEPVTKLRGRPNHKMELHFVSADGYETDEDYLSRDDDINSNRYERQSDPTMLRNILKGNE